MNGARQLKLRRSKRQQNRTLLLILLTAAVIVLGISLVISGSTLPNFYYATPQTAPPPIVPVDWRTLETIAAEPGGAAAARPDLFRSVVQISGYMLVKEGSPPVNGASETFLLVPDAGNWLHPPHLDPSETIEVRLQNGPVRFVNRAAVTVRGTLSVDPRGAYRIQATSVEPAP